MKLLCPQCGGPLEEQADEVDIGVGILRNVLGAECPRCGSYFAVCSECGAWDWQPHVQYCSQWKS